MLLVDRMLDMQPGKSCRGLKNVTMNEAFFQGHYPGNPIMPGVLILEAMAQSASILLLTDERFIGRTPLVGGIEEAKFKRPIVPGDQLIMDAELLWVKGSVGKFTSVATVEGQVAATVTMIFKLMETPT